MNKFKPIAKKLGSIIRGAAKRIDERPENLVPLLLMAGGFVFALKYQFFDGELELLSISVLFMTLALFGIQQLKYDEVMDMLAGRDEKENTDEEAR